MANDKTHSITLIASGVVEARRFVDKNGAHASSAAAVVGISEQRQVNRKPFSAVTGYAYEVEAAEAISEDSFIKPSTDGTGRAAVGSGSDNVGYALNAAAAGGRTLCRFIERAGGGGGGAVLSISGTRAVGQTLTATPSPGWQFTSGQWYRDDVAINGATTLAYTLQPADAGKTPSFVPTAPVFKATAGVVAGDASAPTELYAVYRVEASDQAVTCRIVHRSSPRDLVIVRNVGANAAQIAYTTNNNNNNNGPAAGSWADLAITDEAFETSADYVDRQIWLQPKVNGQLVAVEVTVRTPRI